MKLSIIVPVYNMAAGNKLRFCLDSLVNQTIADYEIIAVDDASTDESLDILKEYEARYPWKFRAIQSYENRRQGGARNMGLEAAEAPGSASWILMTGQPMTCMRSLCVRQRKPAQMWSDVIII